MQVFALPEIIAALDEDAAIAAIEQGFRRFSAGEAQLGAVGYLGFSDAHGDCHIKSAHLAGDDVFVVKVATGFYRNPDLGLPSSNGFMAVLSARTGAPLCLLLDEGRLTDLRTAMAGAIAAKRITRPGSRTLGVIGTGIQAGLQARLIARACGLDSVRIWGRNAEAARTLAAELREADLEAQPVGEIGALCASCDLMVTTTPATTPLVTKNMVGKGARIIAVGADAPNKCELDPALVAAADLLVADSRAQCLDHGEFATAYAQGLIDPAQLVELGTLLSDRARQIAPGAIVIVDLTGLGVQDAQIAQSVWRRLAND